MSSCLVEVKITLESCTIRFITSSFTSFYKAGLSPSCLFLSSLSLYVFVCVGVAVRCLVSLLPSVKYMT